MPSEKDFPQPDEVQEPSISERDPPRQLSETTEDWRETRDAEREQAPTSSHEDEGWRALKPF